MKRVVISIAGTVVGIVALLDFKTHGHAIAGALPAAGLPSASAPASASASASASCACDLRRQVRRVRRKSTSAARTKTATGTAVETRYGVVQVAVTVQGSKITNVRFVQLTAFDQRSAEINSQAAPILLQETLSAQSAQVDTVSGATYTSDGYVQSLQSALDQAGLG